MFFSHSGIVYSIIFCLFGTSLFAQILNKGQSIEAQLFAGRLVKHSPEIIFDVKEPSFGALITWQYQTDGNKLWQQKHNFPRIGVSFMFYDLGEDRLLGEAFGIWPHVGLSLWEKRRFDLSTTFGFGLGYLNRTFDPIDNPSNNAIGSSWNYLVHFRLDAAWKTSPSFSLITGFNLNHFSNGASKLPNLGINLLGGHLGLRYTPQPLSEEDFIQAKGPVTYPEKRWGITMYLALGYREYISVGGPQYPIYLASLAATYQFRVTHKFLAGVEYEFNRGAYAFGQHIGAFQSEREARWRSSRLMLFIADEIFFGDWSALLQLGCYLNNNAILRPSFIYAKLGSRYYFPAIGHPKTRFFAGFYLKAHNSVAEYVSLGIGAEL